MKTPEQIEKEELDKRLEILAKQDAERVIEEQAKVKAQQQLNQQQNKAQQQPPVNQKQEKTVPPPTQPVAGNGPKYPPAQGARDEFSITKLFGDNAKTTVQAQPLNQGVANKLLRCLLKV